MKDPVGDHEFGCRIGVVFGVKGLALFRAHGGNPGKKLAVALAYLEAAWLRFESGEEVGHGVPTDLTAFPPAAPG
jgi:hypothetical protein